MVEILEKIQEPQPTEFELTMERITKLQTPPKVEYGEEPILPPPTKAEIEAQKQAEYERGVQSRLQALGYDKDRQIAILCNVGTSAEHDREFVEMQEARKLAKDEAYSEVYGGIKE